MTDPIAIELVDQEFIDGYRDGYDLTAPEPSENRSHAYRHSFAIGRAEKEGHPIKASYDQLVAAADRALAKDRSA